MKSFLVLGLMFLLSLPAFSTETCQQLVNKSFLTDGKVCQKYHRNSKEKCERMAQSGNASEEEQSACSLAAREATRCFKLAVNECACTKAIFDQERENNVCAAAQAKIQQKCTGKSSESECHTAILQKDSCREREIGHCVVSQQLGSAAFSTIPLGTYDSNRQNHWRETENIFYNFYGESMASNQ